MSPQTETFYYLAETKKEMQKKFLQNEPGMTISGIIPLYADKQLTKKIGTLKYDTVLLDNTQPYPVLSTSRTIVAKDGTIRYEYVSNNYNKITVDTEQTSGIFTKGTVTRTYEGDDKEIRKIVYRSTE